MGQLWSEEKSMTINRPILLVEDNPDEEVLTIRALRRNGIVSEIIIARDGVEALDILFGTGAYQATGPVTPQVVLLDLNLPKLDGLEVLRRIRANPVKRFLPVVMLTSSKEQRDVLRGYQIGCNSYVRKPINFDEFLEATHQLCDYWLRLNQFPEFTPEQIAS